MTSSKRAKTPPRVRSESVFSKVPSVFGYTSSASLLPSFDMGGSRQMPSSDSSIDGEVYVFGSNMGDEAKQKAQEQRIFSADTAPWQVRLLDQRGLEILFIQAKRGPVWLVRPKFPVNDRSQSGSGASSPYAIMRERLGSLWPSLRDSPGLKHLGIFFHGCTNEDVLGALLGLELASYKFTQIVKGVSPQPKFKVSLFGATNAHLKTAAAMGQSMNLARHLVNLDAAKLNPKTYAQAVVGWFGAKPGVTVDVWGPDRVLKEAMNLLYAVGQSAEEGAHMVHLRYRPTGKSRFKSPIAIVGKGVTFDTGGLDIKPPSGMRNMKKDMGGSAAVVGIANWLSESQSDVPCDLYLALAENGIGSAAFHPGDVIKARNGLTVEIHNTDAEGRLVMADVFDVALTRDEKPSLLIDLATLTGAMRVAVGGEIAGFFANRDSLADLSLAKGFETGDPCWRLPLWDGYKSHLKSNFADLANAGDSAFAGAITAALFLGKFVKGDLPWLHFDLYCWSDRAAGSIQDVGGNGQGVQLVASILDELKAKL